MKIDRKVWRRAGITVVIALLGLISVGVWAIPTLIEREIHAVYAGKVSVGGWWINGSSAGIKGLTLHETEAADSPVWLQVESISTDFDPRRTP